MEDKRICVVCPVCGAVDEFEVDDVWALDSFDETHLVEYCVGRCLNCETVLQWEQVYELTRIQNVQKVNPEV